MKWCMDTSALIEPWVRLYPPDIMQPVWTKLEALVAAGSIQAPVEVKLELERQSDKLYEWACAQAGLFVDADREQIEKCGEITNAHRGLVKENSTKSAGDPWVIGLAELRGVPVVTYESLGKAKAPKIPNVCTARGVRCVTLVDVLRQEGFKL